MIRNPSQQRTNVSNVMVIGSGAAGLRAAIAAHETGTEVVVVGSKSSSAPRKPSGRPTSEGYGDLAHALDLRASLVTAEATILCAIERRESRGAHNRLDYPDLAAKTKVNFVVTSKGGELFVSDEAVPPVPEHLQAWAVDDEDVDVAGRLLE